MSQWVKSPVKPDIKTWLQDREVGVSRASNNWLNENEMLHFLQKLNTERKKKLVSSSEKVSRRPSMAYSDVMDTKT